MTTSQQHFRSFHRDHRLVPLSATPLLLVLVLTASLPFRLLLCGPLARHAARSPAVIAPPAVVVVAQAVVPALRAAVVGLATAWAVPLRVRAADLAWSAVGCPLRRHMVKVRRLQPRWVRQVPAQAGCNVSAERAEQLASWRKSRLEVRRCTHGRPSLQRVEQNPSSIASSMSSSTSSFMCLRSGV